MDASKAILATIQSLLKKKKLTQPELAKALNVSTSTIKKLLTGKIALTIDRLAEIAAVLNIDSFELINITKFGNRRSSVFLTLEQEKGIASEDESFAIFYLIVMGFSPREILKKTCITEQDLIKQLIKLEKLHILELHPKDKLKVSIYRKSRWNFSGPLHEKYMVAMAEDFARAIYKKKEALVRFFINTPLSSHSKTTVVQKIKELLLEIEQLSELDLNTGAKIESNINIMVGADEWMPKEVRRLQKNLNYSDNVNE